MMDDKRTHPNNLQAERSVLATLISNPELMGEVQLDPLDFWDDCHKNLYRLMLEMKLQREPMNLVSLPERVMRTKEPGKYGGVNYVIELPEFGDNPALLESNCAAIRADSHRRQLMTLASALHKSAAMGAEPPEVVIGAHQAAVAAVGALGRSVDVVTAGEAVDECVFDWAAIEQSDRGMMGMSTGFGVLDAALSGFCDGDLIVIAARPAMGKTALLLQFVEGMAADDGREGVVVVVSLEMTPKQMAGRMALGIAGVDPELARSGRLQAADWDRIFAARATIGAMPIVFVDAPGCTMDAVKLVIRKAEAKFGRVRAYAIDYLQLMRSPGSQSKMNENERINEITKEGKILAKELKAPGLILSQLSRGVESRADKRPMMSDLRASGGIEQDADVILMIYRDEYYDAASQDAGRAEVIITKQRNGPAGVTKFLAYSKGRFANETDGGAWL